VCSNRPQVVCVASPVVVTLFNNESRPRVSCSRRPSGNVPHFNCHPVRLFSRNLNRNGRKEKERERASEKKERVPNTYAETNRFFFFLFFFLSLPNANHVRATGKPTPRESKNVLMKIYSVLYMLYDVSVRDLVSHG